jgi:hypothetical protein
MAGFKERYGNRAKNVMYATATKQSMRHEEVKLDGRGPRGVTQEAAGGVTVKKEYDDKDESEHGVYHGKKKIGYVVHDKKSDTHTAYHGHKYGKDDYENSDDFQSHEKAINQIKSSAGLKEEVKLDEAKSNYELYHPQYSGAIHHALAHHASKSGLSVHDDDYFNHVSVGPRKPVEGQTVSHHIPATDDKGNPHFIHMQIYNRGADKKPFELNTYSSKVPKRNVKEEIENLQELGGMSTSGASDQVSEDPVVDTLAGPKSINTLPKKRAKELKISNGHESAKLGTLKAESKTPGDNSVPFVTDEKSPLNLAKKIAHRSFKKIKNEMLGKDGGTSE